eukprot:273849-Hanusia_phi.AAC.1
MFFSRLVAETTFKFDSFRTSPQCCPRIKLPALPVSVRLVTDALSRIEREKPYKFHCHLNLKCGRRRLRHRCSDSTRGGGTVRHRARSECMAP